MVRHITPSSSPPLMDASWPLTFDRRRFALDSLFPTVNSYSQAHIVGSGPDMVNWKPDSAVHCHGRCLKPGNPMATNTADIRQYLISAYSDVELTTLSFDYFRDAYDNFAEGMTKTAKIQLCSIIACAMD